MKVMTEILRSELELSKWILRLTIDFYMDEIQLRWIDPKKASIIINQRKHYYNVIKLAQCPIARFLAHDFMAREFEAFNVTELYRDLLQQVTEGAIYCAVTVSSNKTHEYIIFQ